MYAHEWRFLYGLRGIPSHPTVPYISLCPRKPFRWPQKVHGTQACCASPSLRACAGTRLLWRDIRGQHSDHLIASLLEISGSIPHPTPYPPRGNVTEDISQHLFPCPPSRTRFDFFISHITNQSASGSIFRPRLRDFARALFLHLLADYSPSSNSSIPWFSLRSNRLLS
jgi:hypothetical protein